ncbi:hypothetical protein LPJ61_000862 [Coemansia biformis]|uniref:GST C-terminal domain-containing protein n=1 Tax=Coemansia biformis TaxID=1286918 RepID=A0A9W8D181_9FUNG|nr:hypothetical protein LPJ61_000862 [Coemansia biformis]
MYSVYAWGSPFAAEGLSSFDPSCLSIQAYLQLCKADWQLHWTSGADISPSSSLPALTCGGSVVESGFWHIVEFLRSEGHNLDAGLDQEQVAQATAYISMVRDGLADALLFSWFLVSENFVGVIRPRLAQLFGFPLSLVVPTQLKSHAEQRLGASGPTAGHDEPAGADGPGAGGAADTPRSRIPRIYLLAKHGFRRYPDRSAHPVYAQAAEYLAVLSLKLGSKQYFFGDRPSTLDAVVYGYLSPIIRVALPQDTLRTAIVDKHPNLAAHCERIHAQLEQPVPASTQGALAGMLAAAKQSILRYAALPALPLPDAKDNPQRAEKVRSATGALLVFLAYVVYNGIVSAPSPKTMRTSENPGDAADMGGLLSAVKDM